MSTLQKIQTWYKASYISPIRIQRGRRYITLVVDGKKKIKSYARAKYSALKRVNLPKSLVIDHKDGDRLNDRLSNLRPLTYSENNLEAYRLGLKKPTPKHGELNSKAVLTEQKVLQLRKLYATSNKTIEECAKQCKVNTLNAKCIIAGKRWPHITDWLKECREKKLSRTRIGRKSSLSKSVVRQSRKLIADGHSIAKAASALGISKDALYRELRK